MAYNDQIIIKLTSLKSVKVTQEAKRTRVQLVSTCYVE